MKFEYFRHELTRPQINQLYSFWNRTRSNEVAFSNNVGTMYWNHHTGEIFWATIRSENGGSFAQLLVNNLDFLNGITP